MIDLGWIEVIEDESSDWFDGCTTETSVVFIDLHFAMTVEKSLSDQNSMTAQIRSVTYRESKFLAPKTVEVITIKPSMTACSIDNAVLLVVNLGTQETFPYYLFV